MKALCVTFLSGLLVAGGFHTTHLQAKEVAGDFSDVAAEAIPAVVSIKVKIPQKTFGPWGNDQDFDLFQQFFRQRNAAPVIGQGSGFIISSDGYLLSNTHVVQGASEITVTTNDGREFPAKVIGTDPSTDVAVLKIESNNLPYLKLGNSDDLRVGQWVIAIGNPLGLQATLTVGVVSAKGRNNLDLTSVEDFIQTDASINHGNSGGPLLNIDGQVIGMNTAIFTAMANGGSMGIGMAIPSNIAKLIMDEIIHDGHVSRGYLGVTLQPVDSNLAKAFGLDRVEGALVADVQQNSPADKIGLKAGDIIMKFNQKPVSSGAALRTAISLLKPGTKATLTVLREGKTEDYTVELGNFPQAKPVAAATPTPPQTNTYGFSVDALTPEIARQLGNQSLEGVVITHVDPNSLGALAGLKQGAIIVAINKKPITSVEQFNQELKNTPQDKPVLFLIRQGEFTKFVSIKIG